MSSPTNQISQRSTSQKRSVQKVSKGHQPPQIYSNNFGPYEDEHDSYQRQKLPNIDSCIEEVSRDDEEYTEIHKSMSSHDLNKKGSQLQILSDQMNMFNPLNQQSQDVNLLKQLQDPEMEFQQVQQVSQSLNQRINGFYHQERDDQVSSVLHESSKSSINCGFGQKFINDNYSSIQSSSSQQSNTNQRSSETIADNKKALYLKLRGNQTQGSQSQRNIDKENSQNFYDSKSNNQAPLQITQFSDRSKSNLVTNDSDQQKSFNQSNHSSQNINDGSSLQSIQLLQAEIEKWKKFGYLMAESFDELKKEHEKYKQDKDKDKKIIDALKDQIIKLKQIIQAKNLDESSSESDYQAVIRNLQDENIQLKQIKKEKDAFQQEVQHQGEIISQLNEKLQKAKVEVKQLQQQIIKIQNTQQIQQSNNPQHQPKTSQYTSRNELTQNHQSSDQASYYKKLSHQHLRECSQLADELICLRSDADKSLHGTIRSNSISGQPRNQSYQRSLISQNMDNNLTEQALAYQNNSRNGSAIRKRSTSAMKSEAIRSSIMSSNQINTPQNHRNEKAFHQNSLPLSPIQDPNPYEISNRSTASKVIHHQRNTNYEKPPQNSNLSPIQNHSSTLSNQRQNSSQHKQMVKINKIFKDEDQNESQQLNVMKVNYAESKPSNQRLGNLYVENMIRKQNSNKSNSGISSLNLDMTNVQLYAAKNSNEMAINQESKLSSIKNDENSGYSMQSEDNSGKSINNPYYYKKEGQNFGNSNQNEPIHDPKPQYLQRQTDSSMDQHSISHVPTEDLSMSATNSGQLERNIRQMHNQYQASFQSFNQFTK